MAKFLIKWLVNIFTLFIVIHIVAGVSADSWESIIVAALVLGLLNAFVKPFVILFTLPFTILTLGLFTLIINAAIFYLASKFVKGFEVIDFWSAFWAALLFSIISSILNFLLTPKTAIHFASFRGRSSGASKLDDDNVIDVEGKVEK
ncbi:MAG: phage holin family protein [Candidatus Omnitrophica bacterium]|nr:phage holin family protein [Candidatus Omnitrophota bacterium]